MAPSLLAWPAWCLYSYAACGRNTVPAVSAPRLKLRLMAIFAAMAVVPGALVYAVSLQFAVKSIESWFNVRVDTALESGLQLGRTTLEILLDQLANKADQVALELESAAPIRPSQLNQLRERAGIESATVFTPNGKIVATADIQLDTLMPEQPNAAQLRQARQTRGYRAAEGNATEGLVLRVIVPIPSRRFTEPQLLQVTQEVPPLVRDARRERRDRSPRLPGVVPRPQRAETHLHTDPHPHTAAGPCSPQSPSHSC